MSLVPSFEESEASHKRSCVWSDDDGELQMYSNTSHQNLKLGNGSTSTKNIDNTLSPESNFKGHFMDGKEAKDTQELDSLDENILLYPYSPPKKLKKSVSFKVTKDEDDIPNGLKALFESSVDIGQILSKKVISPQQPNQTKLNEDDLNKSAGAMRLITSRSFKSGQLMLSRSLSLEHSPFKMAGEASRPIENCDTKYCATSNKDEEVLQEKNKVSDDTSTAREEDNDDAVVPDVGQDSPRGYYIGLKTNSDLPCSILQQPLIFQKSIYPFHDDLAVGVTFEDFNNAMKNHSNNTSDDSDEYTDSAVDDSDDPNASTVDDSGALKDSTVDDSDALNDSTLDDYSASNDSTLDDSNALYDSTVDDSDVPNDSAVDVEKCHNVPNLMKESCLTGFLNDEDRANNDEDSIAENNTDFTNDTTVLGFVGSVICSDGSIGGSHGSGGGSDGAVIGIHSSYGAGFTVGSNGSIVGSNGSINGSYGPDESDGSESEPNSESNDDGGEDLLRQLEDNSLSMDTFFIYPNPQNYSQFQHFLPLDSDSVQDDEETLLVDGVTTSTEVGSPSRADLLESLVNNLNADWSTDCNSGQLSVSLEDNDNTSVESNTLTAVTDFGQIPDENLKSVGTDNQDTTDVNTGVKNMRPNLELNIATDTARIGSGSVLTFDEDTTVRGSGVVVNLEADMMIGRRGGSGIEIHNNNVDIISAGLSSESDNESPPIFSSQDEEAGSELSTYLYSETTSSELDIITWNREVVFHPMPPSAPEE